MPHVTRQNIGPSAAGIRAALGLGAAQTPTTAGGNDTLGYWRAALEHHGFIVFQTTGVDIGDFRGLSVYHRRLPIILINGADSANGRIFTLVHELAHLANRTSGLCLLEDLIADEALCNAFAAEFLMPQAAVRDVLVRADANDPDTPIAAVARHFRVSRLAAAVKLRSLGVISQATLDVTRARSDEEWRLNRRRQHESAGSPPHWRLRLRDLGPTYVSAVFRALEDERIGLLDATYLLDAKVPTIEHMLAEYHRTGGAL